MCVWLTLYVINSDDFFMTVGGATAGIAVEEDAKLGVLAAVVDRGG